ncbi:MAG: nucleoside 2-deoxyribosyltransferase domain-containing protein [Candidatus Paceibacterota bacterium]
MENITSGDKKKNKVIEGDLSKEVFKSIQYIESPSIEKAEKPSLFLAGGITNCPDWQSEMVKKMDSEGLDITVFNPRRKNYPREDPNAEKEQITWEYSRLREAQVLLFWFSPGSENPIVLFELGSALERNASVLVGVDPNYSRKRDVEIQVGLKNKNIKITYSLDDLLNEASETFNK